MLRKDIEHLDHRYSSRKDSVLSMSNKKVEIGENEFRLKKVRSYTVFCFNASLKYRTPSFSILLLSKFNCSRAYRKLKKKFDISKIRNTDYVML